MGAGDQRPEVRRLLARVPLADRGGGVREPIDEVVVDGTLDQEPRPGETHLAGVVELVDRLRERCVGVGVGEASRTATSRPARADTGVRFAAAASATSLPVSTEPVNAMRATPGSLVSAAPASSPIPWTTLKTPSGRPASRAMSARSDAVRGAHSGGF